MQPLATPSPDVPSPDVPRETEPPRITAQRADSVDTASPPAEHVSAPMPTAPAVSGDPLIDTYFETMRQFLEVDAEMMRACLGGAAMETPDLAMAPAQQSAEPRRFPLLSEVTASPGGGLRAMVTVSSAQWPYLEDHSFGRGISARDPGLSGLQVVPLTFSIEVLAEAAAALHPDLVVSALQDVRASRWLALDRPERRYEVSAEPLSPAPEARVRVRLRDAEGPALRPILVEAEVHLAAALPPAPPPGAAGHRRAATGELERCGYLFAHHVSWSEAAGRAADPYVWRAWGRGGSSGDGTG